jgi:hypothetical protein
MTRGACAAGAGAGAPAPSTASAGHEGASEAHSSGHAPYPVAAAGQCKCPRYLRRVCGANGQTYNNDCLAKCAGTDVVSQGECKGAWAPILIG